VSAYRGAELLAGPSTRIGARILLLSLRSARKLLALVARRDDAGRAGVDECLLDVLHERADLDVLQGAVSKTRRR